MTARGQSPGDFAGALVHELRTPLTAIAAEVDLALARERSPDAYRAAIARIGECAAELTDLTADLAALYGNDAEAPADGPPASLSAVLDSLGARYGARRGAPVTFATGPLRGRVEGPGPLITLALSQIIEHALKHRRGGARVGVRALPPEGPVTSPRSFVFRLDAPPDGFNPAAWAPLAASLPAAGRRFDALRLETAASIIRGFGGSVDVSLSEGTDGVLIRLRAAARRPDEAEDCS